MAQRLTEHLGLIAACLVVVAAGIISSSLVTLVLLLAIRLAGGVSIWAAGAAALFLVAWLTVLLEVSRQYSLRGFSFTQRQAQALGVCWITALVGGLVFRKVVLFWRPGVFPPMGAYTLILLPATPLLVAWWYLYGRTAYGQLTAGDASGHPSRAA